MNLSAAQRQHIVEVRLVNAEQMLERFHDRSGDIWAHLAVRAGNMATLARL